MHTTNGRKNSIIAVLIEPITGEGILTPPKGFLKDLAELCKKNRNLYDF